jgi:hypothetical protein
LRRFALLMAAPLLVAAAFVGTTVVAVADSQTSCVSPPNCKTVTVDSGGKLTSGSTSGNINFVGLTANTTYNLVDVMETLGTDHQFVGGSYSLNFAGTCTAGSGTGGSYTVNGTAPIISTYPSSPPSTSGTLPTITADGSGNFNCNYTVSYPTIDGTNDSTCGQHLCSARNDLFVMSGDSVVTQTASFSVEPDGAPPTSVPEAPLPILIPAGILLAIGAGIVVWRRRLFASS